MSSIFETDAQLDSLATTAIARTKELMEQSDKLRDRRETERRNRLKAPSATVAAPLKSGGDR